MLTNHGRPDRTRPSPPIGEQRAEQKRAGLRERNARAEAANRAKDEFLATLSHELRTPLTAILGWVRLLQEEQVEPDVLRQGLEVIERNARAQAHLVDTILDLSRIVSGKLHINVRSVDLATAIEAAMASVRLAAAAKQIRLYQSLSTQMSRVSGDPDRLQQIVWNLLCNAIKFTPQGGHVSVKLEQHGAHADIVVSDSGQGIPLKFIPHLFQRFRQADSSSTREHGGLGLGLAITRHLVELHGGTIALESSAAGRGTTFRVRLPLRDTTGPCAPEPPAAASS